MNSLDTSVYSPSLAPVPSLTWLPKPQDTLTDAQHKHACELRSAWLPLQRGGEEGRGLRRGGVLSPRRPLIPAAQTLWPELLSLSTDP